MTISNHSDQRYVRAGMALNDTARTGLPRRAGEWPPWWRPAVRLLGAASLLGMAWIHWHLYGLGYRTVPTIGPLFLLNAVLGVVLALAVLLAPGRWLRVACAAGALFQIGTLAALVQSLTIGAFGFTETLNAPLILPTFLVEGFGFLVLTAGAFGDRVPAGGAPGGPWGQRMRRRSG